MLFMIAVGKHIIVDMRRCPRKILDDVNVIEKSLLGAASYANATVIDYSFRKFHPQGVSGIVIIAESHISIHTWPEYGYAAVDVFTCGSADASRAVEYIVKALKSKEHYILDLKRGVLTYNEMKIVNNQKQNSKSEKVSEHEKMQVLL